VCVVECDELASAKKHSLNLSLLPIHTPLPPVTFYTPFPLLHLPIAALVGHDGYAYPGGGSQCHWLHHNNFDCNYGENYAPFDYLFGSYAADEADFEKLKEKRAKAYADNKKSS